MKTIRLWLHALWFRKHWQVSWDFAIYCARLHVLRLTRDEKEMVRLRAKVRTAAFRGHSRMLRW